MKFPIESGGPDNLEPPEGYYDDPDPEPEECWHLTHDGDECPTDCSSYQTCCEALEESLVQCAWCRRIRVGGVGGRWVAEPIPKGVRPERVSHGMCPDCAREHVPPTPAP